MSRLLTSKNSLPRAQITSGDRQGDDLVGDAELAMAFLFEQSNLKVLYKRSIDVVNTLGFASSFDADGTTTLNTGARLNALTITLMDAQGDADARMIQNRVARLVIIMRQFLPQFQGAMGEALDNNFSRSQALNIAFDSVMEGFKSAVEAQNLMKPAITVKIKILTVVKSRAVADKLYDLLTYSFE